MLKVNIHTPQYSAVVTKINFFITVLHVKEWRDTVSAIRHRVSGPHTLKGCGVQSSKLVILLQCSAEVVGIKLCLF